MFDQPVEDCRLCPIGSASSPKSCPFVRGRHTSGTMLCSQGEPASSLIFVRRGYVALSALGPDGGETAISIRGPGALLGLEVLTGMPVAREARAVGPVATCSLPRSAIAGWLGAEHGPMRALLGIAVNELGRERFEDALRTGSSVRRVAAFALACGGVLGTERRGMNKGVAARLLGMRAETFSRSLRWLADRGLVDSRRGLRVLDADRLARVAGDGRGA